MKLIKVILLTIWISFFMLSSCKESNPTITALSYNIRYDSRNDGVNIWENRKHGLVTLLKSYNPDIIGIQEGQNHQLEFINSQLKSFKMIGDDREGNGKGEYSSIFYNTKSLKLIKTETFWLSNTPSTPSIGWDASFNRICTYGLFKSIKSKEQFLVFNTHFDHMGEIARLESAKLITKNIAEINSNHFPVILMGDLNCDPKSIPISIIKESLIDGKEISEEPLKGPIGTFTAFDIYAPLENRIDYIFVKDFKVLTYSHINDKLPNGNWPSDHLPVLAKLQITK
jgi:endonuclease/exonuclease/phosphatase family metal-dependent hydrolase